MPPRLLLAVLIAAGAPFSLHAEEGIRSMRDGLRPQDAAKLDAKIDARMRWIHGLSEYLGRGYRLPASRPEIYMVSRDYIIKNEKEICFSSKTPEQIRDCSSRVFGWIDDDRKIYVLHAEDVLSTRDFPGANVRDFSAELWVEMTWTHELVHYAQMDGSPYRPTTMPCEVQGEWESDAFFFASQWLHSLQSVDAERINTVFRGQRPPYACDPADRGEPAG